MNINQTEKVGSYPLNPCVVKYYGTKDHYKVNTQSTNTKESPQINTSSKRRLFHIEIVDIISCTSYKIYKRGSTQTPLPKKPKDFNSYYLCPDYFVKNKKPMSILQLKFYFRKGAKAHFTDVHKSCQAKYYYNRKFFKNSYVRGDYYGS